VLGTEPIVIQQYVHTGKVKLVYHHILDFGNRSLAASEGAECAGAQGLFWPMHDLLYKQQDKMWQGDPRQEVLLLARDVPGLDIDAFRQCMAQRRYAARVQEDDRQRRSLHIRTRPTLDINGHRVEGAVPFQSLKPILDKALQASGSP